MSKYAITPQLESEARTRNFIDVGIHENVELVDIKYGLSPNNNKFVVFTFEKDGKQLTHTEWEPNDKDPAVLDSKIANQMKRFKHIATKFISNDEFVIDANDFESFAKAYIDKLTDKYNGKKVRVKVIYSNSGFTTLPKYVPFIESMDVPKEKSQLEILSIDKMSRDTNSSFTSPTSTDTDPFNTDNAVGENLEVANEAVAEDKPPF